MYIYSSHIGGLYGSEVLLSHEDRCCETCGDCDEYLGWADTPEDVLVMLADNIDIPEGFGGFDIQYIMDILCNLFPNCRAMSSSQAKNIILQHRTQQEDEE